MKPRFHPSPATRAFTIVEVVVAVAITAALAGFIVAILSNVSGFWSRTSGRISAEAQGRYVLDKLALDLQSALYRDDGNTWLAATIPTSNSNSGLWNDTGTTPNGRKPVNNAGSTGSSLRVIATGSLADSSDLGPRFGIAGTWLRFFTTKRGANLAVGTASAPVAVGYQIVRRATTTTPNNVDRRYLFHRTEVTPQNTLNGGFDLLSSAAYNPAQTSPAPAVGTAREIRVPTLNSVIAENVIDFGVRMYVHVRNADTGALELRQIFPTANTDLTHRAVLPPRAPNGDGEYVDCFPEVIDVTVRILTDDGARLIAGYEASPQRVTLPPGRNAQQYWWELAVANSRVFTRRIVLPAQPL